METQEVETQEVETQEAETKEIETKEVETQATFCSLRSKNEDREDLPRKLSSAESFEGTMTSIRSEAEMVFSTDQINSSAAACLSRVLAAFDLCVDHGANSIGLPGSAGGAAANLKYLNSILVPLNDLALWQEQPRNVFREIHMGDYTLLGLLSPLALGTFHTIYSGSGGIRYLHVSGRPGVDGVPETTLPVVGNGSDGVKNELTETNLANSISRFIRKGYKLVRRSQIVFREIQLKEREMMLIHQLLYTKSVGKRVLYSLLAKYRGLR